MAAQSDLVIPDILQEHHEELQFLCLQRQGAIRSARYRPRALAILDERIMAHTDGLVIGGRHAVEMLKAGLSAGRPEVAFAAAYPLLAMKENPAARLVLEAFSRAEGGCRDGLRQALCHGPVATIRSDLQKLLASSPPGLAVATAQVLAFHGIGELTKAQVEGFLKSQQAEIRQAGWRVVSLSQVRCAEFYEAGFRDEDPAVRGQVLQAAAWTRQPNLLEHCRKLAAKPTPTHYEALLLVGILGKPEDLQRILLVGNMVELGPRRFRVLGAYGHPGVVDTLQNGMRSSDPLTAAGAAAAFTKITGSDINSGARVPVPSAGGEGPADFDNEFLEEVSVPDLQRAQDHWNAVRAQFAKGTRWCQGLNLGQQGLKEVVGQLDLQSRWEASLRGQFEGTWKGSLSQLEVLPQGLL
jgi:uncharacterized protein (TIGR02270 family)